MSGQQELLRSLPAVDRVLREEPLQNLSTRLPQELLTTAAQQAVAELRSQLLSGGTLSDKSLGPAQVAAVAARLCQPLGDRRPPIQDYSAGGLWRRRNRRYEQQSSEPVSSLVFRQQSIATIAGRRVGALRHHHVG